MNKPTNYRFTYHRGIAIGPYVEDRIVLSHPLSLKLAVDKEMDAKIVYDSDVGVVFIFDCKRESFWVAGRIHGSDGSDWSTWTDKLKKLRERNSNIPDWPINIVLAKEDQQDTQMSNDTVNGGNDK